LSILAISEFMGHLTLEASISIREYERVAAGITPQTRTAPYHLNYIDYGRFL